MSQLKNPLTRFDHSQGPADAAITLVEYGDYQCPPCGEAYPIIKKLRAALGDKLRFVFRNFPLSQIHPDALGAAKAAEAAGRQGKFWEMHDCLFEHQNKLQERDIRAYAKELGLDHDSFQKDRDDADLADRIKADFNGGVRSGVSGTPSFFINGEKYDGAWDFEAFQNALSAPSKA